MKKILSILLFSVFCVSVSFTFASCASIFAGNYKLVSKEKCEAYFSSIGYGGFELFTDGFCAEIEMKAISGINQSYNFVLRYNKNENIMSGKINSNNEGYIRNSEYYYDGTYFYEKIQLISNYILLHFPALKARPFSLVSFIACM